MVMGDRSRSFRTLNGTVTPVARVGLIGRLLAKLIVVNRDKQTICLSMLRFVIIIKL